MIKQILNKLLNPKLLFTMTSYCEWFINHCFASNGQYNSYV